jgi:hypothetical protein
MSISQSSRAAARDAGLHLFGAVSAIVMLALALSVTTNMLRPRRPVSGVAADPPYQRAWHTDHFAAVVPGRSRLARLRRMGIHQPTPVVHLAFGIPLKAFVPPPQEILPTPEYAYLSAAPEIACTDGEAVTPPVTEFSLPPRPRRGVVRVILAALSPFWRVARYLAQSEQPEIMGD